MATPTMEPIAPSNADVEIARESSRRLSKLLGRKLGIAPTGGDAALSSTETIEIPAGALPIIQFVLASMAKGLAVSLMPVKTELTTQQAANLLGVSRPFVIKLLEGGELPFRKVGRHRRIELDQLVRYKATMRVERHKALDELSAESQALGVGY